MNDDVASAAGSNGCARCAAKAPAKADSDAASTVSPSSRAGEPLTFLELFLLEQRAVQPDDG
jgi:hypothetical protein